MDQSEITNVTESLKRITKLIEAVQVGQEMRDAQTKFFKIRSQKWLERSKELEKKFDKLCEEALQMTEQQQTIFKS